jgi:hypothetical protein
VFSHVVRLAVRGCVCAAYGGAIYSSNAFSVQISQAAFTGNSAAQFGSSVFVQVSQIVELSQVSFSSAFSAGPLHLFKVPPWRCGALLDAK